MRIYEEDDEPGNETAEPVVVESDNSEDEQPMVDLNNLVYERSLFTCLLNTNFTR